MSPRDLERARALMTEALELFDLSGASIAAARLQWVLDTLPECRSANRVREERRTWRPSD